MNKLSGTSLVSISLWMISLLIPFYFFSQTACPSVYWLDTGEILTALTCFGLAHSPSFPVFMLANKILLWIPLGDVAYRGNLTSAFWGSLIAGLIFKLFLMLTKKYPKNAKYVYAYIASFLVCLNPMFWFQCLKAEVYTLHLFMVLLIVFFSVKIFNQRKNFYANYKYWMIVTFLFSLSLGNHSLLTLHLVPALIFLAIISKLHKLLNIRSALMLVALFILGLSVYLYLPIRSLKNPLIDLGNPEHVSTFLFSVTRKGSMNRFFGNQFSIWLSSFIRYFKLMSDYFPLVFLPLTFLSSIIIVFKKKALGIFFFFLIFVNIGITLLNRQFNTNPDTGPAYLMMSTTFSIFVIIWAFYDLGNSIPYTFAKNTLLLSLCLISLLSIYKWIYDFTNKHSLKDNLEASRIGRAILDSCLPKSILFTGFHYNFRFILTYLQSVELYRKDILIIDRAETVFWPGGLEKFLKQFPELERLIEKKNTKRIIDHLKYRGVQNSLLLTEKEAKDFVSKLIATFSINISKKNFVYWFPSEDDRFLKIKIVPIGIIYRIIPPISEGECRSLNRKLIKYESKSWRIFCDRIIIRNFLEKGGEGKKILSDMLVNLGNAVDFSGDSKTALNIYEHALKISPNSQYALYNKKLVLSSQ